MPSPRSGPSRSSDTLVLAGDVGGTKTNVGVFRVRGDGFQAVRTGHYANAERASLVEILRDFLGVDRPAIDAACFGIAGPIEEDHVEATNLPWRIEARELGRALATERVSLINDLVATAEGLAWLARDRIEVLHEGRPAPGAAELVVAAGTGLGVAWLMPHRGELAAQPSEGGHADFAPRNDMEAEFADFLHARYGRASVERAVSGPGLIDAYEHFASAAGHAEDEEFARRWLEEDRGELVSEYGLARRSLAARRALELFVSAYGAAAGNLALAGLARGGVWLGGGIAPEIAPILRGPLFREAFVDKGRLRPILEPIPIRLILDQEAALLGAARHAALSA